MNAETYKQRFLMLVQTAALSADRSTGRNQAGSALARAMDLIDAAVDLGLLHDLPDPATAANEYFNWQYTGDEPLRPAWVAMVEKRKGG